MIVNLNRLIILLFFGLVWLPIGLIAQIAPEKPTEPKGVKPRAIRKTEEAYYGRITRQPYIKGKYHEGGGDQMNKFLNQLDHSIQNWEYNPNYRYKDGFWTRLMKDWYPDKLLIQHPLYKRQTEEMGAGFRGSWTGDWEPSNRGNNEEVEAGLHGDFIGVPFTDKRGLQQEHSQSISKYQGNIRIDKRIVQKAKATEIADWDGNYVTNKLLIERGKAKQLSDYDGNYVTNKLLIEEKKAKAYSDYEGNIITNKLAVQKRKAEEISDYEGTWLNDKQDKEDKTAKDSRNFKGGIRIRNSYLRSHDSKSLYRVIPKGKRDKKEKDLWYD